MEGTDLDEEGVCVTKFLDESVLRTMIQDQETTPIRVTRIKHQSRRVSDWRSLEGSCYELL